MTCPHPEKIRYPHLETAFEGLRSLALAGKDDGNTLPYRCECGVFHLGHPKGFNRKMRQAYDAYIAKHPTPKVDYTTNRAAIERRMKRALKRSRR